MIQRRAVRVDSLQQCLCPRLAASALRAKDSNGLSTHFSPTVFESSVAKSNRLFFQEFDK